MGGYRLTTTGDGVPHALSEKGLPAGHRAGSFTVRRDPTDTAGGIVYVGPDRAGAQMPLQAGDFYWEKDMSIDPANLAWNDNGVSGAKLNWVWVNSGPGA